VPTIKQMTARIDERISEFTYRVSKSHQRNIVYEAMPRYTSGSPAQVPRDTAVRVAITEWLWHDRALGGVYGREAQRKAEEKGVGGIAEARVELRTSWAVLDLITGAWEQRPFPRA